MKHYCEHASRLASDMYERPLTRRERFRLHFHLWICRACKNYFKALAVMHEVLEKLREQPREKPVLSETQKERIRQAIHTSVDS